MPQHIWILLVLINGSLTPTALYVYQDDCSLSLQYKQQKSHIVGQCEEYVLAGAPNG